MILPIKNGYSAIVDKNDFHEVSRFNWGLTRSPTGTMYVVRTTITDGGARSMISLHRQLMRAEKGQQVDHKNGNGLDCRRRNMRITTIRGNARSFRTKSSGKSSVFRGVSWQDNCGKWTARVCERISGKTVNYYLGCFADEIAAALAYNKKASELGFFPEALNKIL